MINVLALDSKKIEFLLSNHKFFTKTEITLAAKIKVINDKKAEYSALAEMQRNGDLWSYNREMIRAANAFNDGYNGSLQEHLFRTRLF